MLRMVLIDAIINTRTERYRGIASSMLGYRLIKQVSIDRALTTRATTSGAEGPRGLLFYIIRCLCKPYNSKVLCPPLRSSGDTSDNLLQYKRL
jgi:hypothetical protein